MLKRLRQLIVRGASYGSLRQSTASLMGQKPGASAVVPGLLVVIACGGDSYQDCTLLEETAVQWRDYEHPIDGMTILPQAAFARIESLTTAEICGLQEGCVECADPVAVAMTISPVSDTGKFRRYYDDACGYPVVVIDAQIELRLLESKDPEILARGPVLISGSSAEESLVQWDGVSVASDFEQLYINGDAMLHDGISDWILSMDLAFEPVASLTAGLSIAYQDGAERCVAEMRTLGM